MEKMNFKTNIMCDACIKKVTPFLNEAAGENNWKVDIKDPNKILTVEGGDPAAVVEALNKAGYKAGKI